jgi:hypothetical protein
MGRAGVVVSGGWRLAGVLGLVGGSWLLFPAFGGGICLAGGKVTNSCSRVMQATIQRLRRGSVGR